MKDHIVKTKYTYEKVRQTDYGYGASLWQESHNAVRGRYIYDVGDLIYFGCADGHMTDIMPEIANKIFASSGIFVKAEGKDKGGLIRVTLFGKDDSFSSACTALEATSPRGAYFYFKNVDFIPERILAECNDGGEYTLSVHFVNILNYLGEWGGQTHFYESVGCEMKDMNGAMTLDIHTRGHIDSPIFPDTSDTVYNMLMPRRNTVFAVIRNTSGVKTARLYFRTTAYPEFSDDASLTLSLYEDGAPHAYYFNLSATDFCSGRLVQFRLEFEGDGEVVIERYSFEQEEKIWDAFAHITSSLANYDNGTISVTGSVNSDVDIDGAQICLCMTDMEDEDDENVENKQVLACIPAARDFKIDGVELHDGVTSRVMYQFVCFMKKDGAYTRMTDRFYIENYEDTQKNPYEFSLPDRCVSVLDFGAFGDAFHDDTDAIQAALDHIYKCGGGTVNVPGSCDRYGRRYIVTNLLIRSNTELHFEDGAVLWQSQMRDDYTYAVTYGHDAYIPGVNWTHSMHVSQLPMIQVANSDRVKVTGKGKLRSMDIGSEEGVDMKMRYSTGCPDRIHLITLGFFGAEYVECRDFEIVRSNNYHSAFYGCEKVYCANLKYHEAKCLSGDGFGLIAGTHDVLVNRCFFQSNDDGIVLTSVYNDPRGTLWWTNAPETHAGPYDITVCHSYLNAGTGKSIAFITWGTNDHILERTQISGISVYDNCIIATNPIGAWHDNPYNGRVPFDNMEMDDYSPVNSVRILHNRYRGNCTLGPVRPTDFISDCGIYSSDRFENGDFTLGGLANWTGMPNESPRSVRTVLYANKEKGCIDLFELGDVSLACGMHLTNGRYMFECEVMTGDDGAYLYASDILTGKLLNEVKVCEIMPKCVNCTFDVEKDQDVYVGVKNASNSKDGFAIIDKCRLNRV